MAFNPLGLIIFNENKIDCRCYLNHKTYNPITIQGRSKSTCSDSIKSNFKEMK